MEKIVDTRTISHQDWLNYKSYGIGGSDAGAIAGLNPYSSRLCVYFNKIGEPTISDHTDTTESMYWGNRLEDIIAEEFSRREGLKVKKCHYILRSSEHPFMIANVDGIVGSEEGLECKTTNAFNKDQWDDDAIPEMYMAQIQHYMAVTGYEGWWIAVLIGGNHFKYQYVERDEDYIDNLIKLESDFWYNHVQPGIMPEVDGSSASSNLIKKMFPKAESKTSITLNGESNAIINKYLDYCQLESEYSDLKEDSVNKLKMMLGENEKGATDNYIVNWKNVNSNRFNSTAFKKENPDIFKQYSKPSTYRRFSIKSL